MFEHMAFKGTETIGTRNWPEEKKALDAVEEAYDRMEAEANKGVKADQMRVDMLRNQVRLAADNASALPRRGNTGESWKRTAHVKLTGPGFRRLIGVFLQSSLQPRGTLVPDGIAAPDAPGLPRFLSGARRGT